MHTHCMHAWAQNNYPLKKNRLVTLISFLEAFGRFNFPVLWFPTFFSFGYVSDMQTAAAFGFGFCFVLTVFFELEAQFVWLRDLEPLSLLSPYTFYCLILLLLFLSFSCPFVVVVLSKFVFPQTILEFICCVSIFVVVIVWKLRNFVCLRKLSSIWDVLYWEEIFWIFNGPSCQSLLKDSACSKWRWQETSVMYSRVLAVSKTSVMCSRVLAAAWLHPKLQCSAPEFWLRPGCVRKDPHQQTSYQQQSFEPNKF